jgi:hypothetical protein
MRAWTLLDAVYTEVRELGLRFLRYDPKREDRVPSLYAVARGGGQAKKKGKKAEAAADGSAPAKPADGAPAKDAGAGVASAEPAKAAEPTKDAGAKAGNAAPGK